jgi:hypothetical protein
MIFLSASIPDQRRDPKYFQSADIIAIRDAIRAFATVILPKSNLIWGGHPAITPLIRYVMNTMKIDVQSHVTLYQSEFFRKSFPKDNAFFEKIIIVPSKGDRDDSLYEMRIKMFTDNTFVAGVFIGGMEGVEEEFKLFKVMQPKAKIFPVASTGAAAKSIFEMDSERFNQSLLNDYAYLSLFKSIFKDVINL